MILREGLPKMSTQALIQDRQNFDETLSDRSGDEVEPQTSETLGHGRKIAAHTRVDLVDGVDLLGAEMMLEQEVALEMIDESRPDLVASARDMARPMTTDNGAEQEESEVLKDLHEALLPDFEQGHHVKTLSPCALPPMGEMGAIIGMKLSAHLPERWQCRCDLLTHQGALLITSPGHDLESGLEILSAQRRKRGEKVFVLAVTKQAVEQPDFGGTQTPHEGNHVRLCRI
jgi:hypothetical protein